MTVVYITVGILVLIGFGIHLVRHFKLRKLQAKRNNCDLSTESGRIKCKELNIKINQLMNFDNTTGNNS